MLSTKLQTKTAGMVEIDETNVKISINNRLQTMFYVVHGEYLGKFNLL